MTDDIDLRDLFSDDEVDERLDAEQALKGLSFRDAAIVYLYACGHTQEYIGKKVGVTHQRISQILENTCKKAQKSAVDNRDNVL